MSQVWSPGFPESKPASSASTALPKISLLKTADDRSVQQPPQRNAPGLTGDGTTCIVDGRKQIICCRVATLEAELHQKQQSVAQLQQQLETLQVLYALLLLSLLSLLTQIAAQSNFRQDVFGRLSGKIEVCAGCSQEA